MLVALLLQAAITQAPEPAYPLKDKRAEAERLAACNARVTHADTVSPGVLRGPKGQFENGARTQPPLWKRGENRDEGYYAAVARSIDGCPVSTPISLPFALKRGTPNSGFSKPLTPGCTRAKW